MLNTSVKKLLLGTGIFLSLFFGLPFLLFGAFAEMNEGASRLPLIIPGVIFTLVGILLIVKLMRMNALQKRFRTYAALIGPQKVVSLQWIAQKVHKPLRFVTDDLYRAVAGGWFPNAFIDEAGGQILLPNEETGAVNPATCQSCGAHVTVMQQYVSVCPYCGAAIRPD